MTERGRPRSFDRAAALRRAMELFWAKGYDATSMSDLTAAMGINSPSLYAAFGCKEALFEEAVALYGESEGTEIWNALEAPTAREAIGRFLRATAESYTRPGKPAGCLIVLGALHADKGSERASLALRSRRRENVADLRERLERESAALFGTARLWDDGIIDPRDTRKVLAFTLSIARESIVRPLNPITFGVARM